MAEDLEDVFYSEIDANKAEMLIANNDHNLQNDKLSKVLYFLKN